MGVRDKLQAGGATLLATMVVIIGFHYGAAGQSTRGKDQGSANGATGAAVSEVGIERLSAVERVTPGLGGGASGSPLAAAALRNAALQDQLSWVFGGKQQHGWRLYAPLVGSLVGAEGSGVESGEFAARLMSWQRQRGVAATGILDSATLFEMIANWQSARLGEHEIPSADQLVTFPASDCYDPTRAEELRQAERATYAAYKRMVAAAAADRSLGLGVTEDGELAAGEKYFKIISAFRSREYQAQLRAQSPGSGRAGLAVNSPHFTGRALDLYVGGEPVSTKDENRVIQTRTKAYAWLVKNAARFGFHPYFYEPWHWEYVGR